MKIDVLKVVKAIGSRFPVFNRAQQICKGGPQKIVIERAPLQGLLRDERSKPDVIAADAQHHVVNGAAIIGLPAPLDFDSGRRRARRALVRSPLACETAATLILAQGVSGARVRPEMIVIDVEDWPRPVRCQTVAGKPRDLADLRGDRTEGRRKTHVERLARQKALQDGRPVAGEIEERHRVVLQGCSEMQGRAKLRTILGTKAAHVEPLSLSGTAARSSEALANGEVEPTRTIRRMVVSGKAEDSEIGDRILSAARDARRNIGIANSGA